MTADSQVPRPAERLPELEESLQRDASPRNVMLVAEAFRQSGHSARAAELLHPVVTREPTRISPRVLLAWCQEDLGRVEDAHAMLESVRALDPGNPFAREPEPSRPVRPTFVVRAPDPAEAAARTLPPPAPAADPEMEAEPERPLTPGELSRVPPGPLYSATLAEIFEKQGFEDKAIEIYEEVVRRHPDRRGLRDRIVDLRAREAEGASG